MLRNILFISVLTMLVSSIAAQVAISDDPAYVPLDSNYIFKVESKGKDQFRIGLDGGVKLNGQLEVDSLKVNGLLLVTSDGGSFIWRPNWPFPPPLHDLLRVSTCYYTVMGGNKFFSSPLCGMGVNTETPNNMLDVNGGDIDVNTSTLGYMIGDQYVLRHKGITDNILVGVDAGLSLTGGSNLTFVGSGAGQNVTGAGNYTFVGYRAGYSNLGGSTNTFIGSMAGYSEMGDENVYVGWMSGYNSNQASFHNTFVGNVSGYSNQIGMNNTFIGIGTAFNNISGSDNVSLGAGAGPGTGKSNLNNSVAIGAGSQVMNNDQMILGNNLMRVGIGLNGDPSGPQNKLEIDAGINGMNPTLAGNLGASGLRLRDLHDMTLPSPNPRNVVLSVDNNGDVILVSASGSSTPAVDNGLSYSGPTPGAIHLGQSLSASGNPGQLLDDREIPMNGYNFYFNGDASPGVDRVDIGDNTILPLTSITGAKLNVQSHSEHTAGLFVNLASPANLTESFGVKGLKLMGISTYNIGVYGYGETDPTGTSPFAIGVKGIAQNQAVSIPGTAGKAYGIWGEATDNLTGTNYGGYFLANNSLGSNYSVYGDAFFSGPPGPGTPPGPNYAGYFNGDVYIVGTYGPSDRKLKKDIENMDGALDIVMKLKPRTYFYRQGEFPGMALPGNKQYGLIAQEVEEVIPELVMNNVQPARRDAAGNELTAAVDFKSMSYQELIPILVKAIQEQQEQIDRQEALIQELSAKVGGGK